MAGKTIDGRAGVTALAALFALMVASHFAAVPAEARWNVDPCENLSLYPPPPGERTLCGPKDEIASTKVAQLPSDPSSMRCSGSEKVAGTGVAPPPESTVGETQLWDSLAAHWDFWSHNGEWVTWTGLGHWEVNWQPGSRRYAASYAPTLFNWAPWRWKVRPFINCDRVPASRSQGSLSERDHADQTVEPGDAGNDVIEGEGEDDTLVGEGGDDELHGAGGEDELVGGFGEDTGNGGGGDDYYLGGGGEDTARGGDGDDQLLGGPHDDTAFGGGGSDELFDNEGRDEVHGGQGDDRFSTRDRSEDTIRCGDGEDIVWSDRRDRVSADCEHVYRTQDDVPKSPPKT